MPRTFRSHKSGVAFTVPDNATDEQIAVEGRQAQMDGNRAAVQAGLARKNQMGGMGALEEFMGGPTDPQAAQTGVIPYPGMAEGGVVPPGSSQGPSGAFSVGQEPIVQDIGQLTQAKTIGDLEQTIYDLIRPPDPTKPGEVLEKAALPLSLAAGPVGPAVGIAVRGAASRVLTPFLARGAGAVARVGTGAATLGGPIAASEIAGGEDPTTALKRGGLYGLLGELGGMVGGGALQKVAGRSKKLLPEAMKVQEVLEPLGASLTIGQLSKSKPHRLVEGILERTIGGGGRYQAVREKSKEAASNLLRSHIDDLPVRGGDVIRNMYDDLGVSAGTTTVDFNPVMKTVRELVEAERGRIPEINRMGQWVADIAQDFPSGQVPFNAAARLRKTLLAEERGHLTTLGSQQVQGAARKFAGSLDEAMEAGAKAGPPGLYEAWRATNQAAKLSIFREAAEDMMTSSLKDGQLSGKLLAGKLDRLTHVQRARLDPQALADFKEFANVLRMAEGKAVNESLRLVLQIGQGSIGGLLLGQGDPEQAAMAITVPYLLSLALTNPGAIKYLTRGVRWAPHPRGKEAIERGMALLVTQSTRPKKTPYKTPWEQ